MNTPSPIQRAVERAVVLGGYKGYPGVEFIEKDGGAFKFGGEVNEERVLLSPEFWRCLGKAEGWRTLYGNSLKDFNIDDNFRHYHHACKGRMWHYQWTRFLDHLAEGKSPEDFFTALLADSK